LALALEYNFHDALVVWVLSMFVYTYLIAIGYMPVISIVPRWEMGYANHFFACPFLWIPLLTSHEVRRLLRRGTNMMVFVDKTCIHQTDLVLKEQGIQSLGHFLVSSDKMIILYSDRYFKQIWTVYEFACFLCNSSSGQCVLLPVFFPVLIIVMWFTIYWYCTWTIILHHVAGSQELVRTAVQVPMVVAILGVGNFCLRRYLLSVKQLRNDMARFSVHNTVCSIESDRARVYELISTFMHFKDLVAPSATVRDSLCCFEQLVQQNVGRIVDEIFGWRSLAGLRYRHVLLILSAMFQRLFDVLGAKLARSDPPQETILVILSYLNTAFCINPLMCALACNLQHSILHCVSKWRWCMLTSMGSVGLAILWQAWISLHEEVLVNRAGEASASWLWLLAAVLLLVLHAAATWLVFGSKRQSGSVFRVSDCQDPGCGGCHAADWDFNLDAFPDESEFLTPVQTVPNFPLPHEFGRSLVAVGIDVKDP